MRSEPVRFCGSIIGIKALGNITFSVGEIVDQKADNTPIDVKKGDVITFKAANATSISVANLDGVDIVKADGSEVSYTIADLTTVNVFATGVKEDGSNDFKVSQINFNIAKSPAGIGFANEDVTMTIGEAAPLFNNPNTLDVTCTSTNDKVAYMDETGAVKVLMPGKTTITATTKGNDEFEGGEAVLNLTVRSKAEASAPSAGSNKFTKVTTDAQIAAGNEYIIVSNPTTLGSKNPVQYGPIALADAKSTNKGFNGEYLAEKDATTLADSYTVTNDNVKVFSLENAENEKWYLKCGESYLDASSAKALKLSDTKTAFTITTSENNTIIANGTANSILVNLQNSNNAQGTVTFNNYDKNQQTDVFLYVCEKGASIAIPAIVANFDETDELGAVSYTADGEGNWIVFITKNGSIELKAADESHSVFYSMENQTSTETPSEPLKVAPKDGFQTYDAPILLGDEHKGNKYMIKFYAADENGVESPVESLVVDYTKPTGIEAIEAETEAVYFDLQGNRVAAPETGVYIKVVGGRASKVLF